MRNDNEPNRENCRDELPYRLRQSAKAKYLQLKITLDGLEVVVPSRKKISHREIQQFILDKETWVRKKLKEISLRPPEDKTTLPTLINLRALQQTWSIDYVPTDRTRITIIPAPLSRLTLLGPVADEKRCRQALQAWLRNIAQVFLESRLTQLSNQVSLPFRALTIRNNKTRWGSCTSRGHISLCCKLLFLPVHLVDHVLLHELCHTRHMDHGKRFWGLLKRLDPYALPHAKELKQARPIVPNWVK